jgi:hypothetical protein
MQDLSAFLLQPFANMKNVLSRSYWFYGLKYNLWHAPGRLGEMLPTVQKRMHGPSNVCNARQR